MVWLQMTWPIPDTSDVACDQTRFLVPPPTPKIRFGLCPTSA